MRAAESDGRPAIDAAMLGGAVVEGHHRRLPAALATSVKRQCKPPLEAKTPEDSKREAAVFTMTGSPNATIAKSGPQLKPQP